jgi:putative DNA primase/helicase
MASAVIMHGAEGTGKSYLWEKIVKRIYGKYGITIGQSQLESDFNGWASAKLFAVAEEVVSRAERAHHKGKLKHLITGDTLLINEKMLRLREEPNLMNSVFLSNSTQPMELDYGDRRYYVRRIEQVKPESYFKALVSQVENGGLEAFYGYLMQLELDGFDHNTKPPLNDDKQSLIGLGLSPAAYFHEEWKNGLLDFPYGAARISDLWEVFNRWRAKTNHQHPVNSRVFKSELARYMTQDRKDIRFPTANDAAVTQRVWVPRDLYVKRDEVGYTDTLSQQVCAFHGVLEKVYRRATYDEAA